MLIVVYPLVNLGAARAKICNTFRKALGEKSYRLKHKEIGVTF